MNIKARQHGSKHHGLILLVVLGMLALFSLLAVSYVVVSSQSRASSAGMARRDYRGTPGPKLLDAAMRVALRGTEDPGSALWNNDLLGDVYGTTEPPIQLRVRRFEWAGTPPATPPYPVLSHGNIERPMLLAGRFLRIPIVLNGMPIGNELPGGLPPNPDVWTNRIATFLSGPLRGESFRVIRYIGDTTQAATPVTAAQNYSIVIDLQDVEDRLISVGGITMSTSDWINAMPAGGTNLEKRGLWLCYPDVPVNGMAGIQFSQGYSIQLNAAPYNSHGLGISPDRASATLSQMHTLAGAPGMTGIGTFPVALQPHYGLLGGTMVGDTDECYDAADFNNLWLSHRESGAVDSTGIIPSFHQAAIVNYIANWTPPMTYASFDELQATILRIERACARPLSYRVRDGNGNLLFGANIDFTGSNRGNYGAGLTPQLDVRWTTATNWPTDPQGAPAFIDWLRWLTSGPWDVDSDADGLMDGMWIDANLPLITSREGKLLKTLVSYTIESLDSRLDLNAVGNLTQLNSLYSGTASYDLPTNNAFSVGAGVNLPQGIGFGPADISLRHLLGGDTVYTNFLVSRYANGSENLPGGSGNDLRGQLDTRERRNVLSHSSLPSLPMAVHGRIGVGLDLMGNPRLTNTSVLTAYGNAFDQGSNDAYEARLLFGAHQDHPFSIVEWERFYRPNDWDRSSLSRRLNATFTNHFAVTPLSRHNRSLSMPASRTSGQSNSMFSLLQAIYAYKNPTPSPPMTFAAFGELFPIEFHRAQGLNLNRAFGNGADDDGDGNIDEPEELLQNLVDDDGNGTVDELTASERNPLAFRQRSYMAFNGNVQLSNVAEDYTFGQGIIGGNLDPTYEGLMNSGADYTTRSFHFGQQSRQMLARNLYCLAMLVLPNDLYPSNRANTASVTGKDRARMIAQWAVNAVDFRDSDSAMTRFPYDPEPFDNASGAEPYWLPDVTAGEVVWGNEQVDLVLTESLFTHDLRVKDTSKDDGGGNTLATGDMDYDQYRIPEGSGFFELLCVRTTSTATDTETPGVSPSLYGTFGGSKLLNLSAVTPANASGDVFPVYRIAISAPHPASPETPLKLQDPMHPGGPTARANVTYQLSSNPDLNGLGWNASTPATARPFEIDRVVLFTQPGAFPIKMSTIPDMPSAVTDTELPGRVFDNRSGGNVVLGGGQYLVVGPRQVTYFGSRDLGPVSTNHRPNHHRIVLENAVGTASGSTGNSMLSPYPNWATLFDAANDRVTNKRTAVRDCVAMIAATDPFWNSNPGGGLPPIVDSIGLNVSAPHAYEYYLAPDEYLDSSDTMVDPVNNAPGFKNMRADAYYDFSGGMSTDLPGKPFDGAAAIKYPLGSGAGNWTAGYDKGVPNPGTQEDWCTAFLQRLADPERPWHAAFNPYITTDWIPIDLTVFSGEEDIATPTKFRFMSRQKSGAMADIAMGGYAPAGGPKTFLSYATTDLYDSPTGTATGVYFKSELPMDKLDASSNILIPRPTLNAGSNHYSSLGYLNSTFELRGEPAAPPGGIAPGFVGVPAVPPAALYWPDRQFANPYELMAVPLSAPGQLFQEFSAPLSSIPGMMYSTNTSPNEFGHLPNFVQPLLAGAPGQLAAVSMFELMETQSSWSDAEDFVNPTTIDFAPYSNNAIQDAINEIFPTLRAPYNRISKFVEPGRVNINDISEPGVWQGIMWNAMTASTRNSVQADAAIPYWIALKNSRRGYTIPTPPANSFIPGGNTNLNADFPTQFAGVFKSSFAVGMVPSTRNSVLDAAAVANPTNVTLLRSNLASPPAPLFATTNVTATKHPFSEYLPTTRLVNLTTQRSNVFAVRVTIGFFEYNSSTGLGAEYGDDEGEVKRHSAFYVIDRSVPVAYQPGQDLNTDKCILLRRVIE